jgi:hypothetical protein
MHKNSGPKNETHLHLIENLRFIILVPKSFYKNSIAIFIKKITLTNLFFSFKSLILPHFTAVFIYNLMNNSGIEERKKT